MIYSAPRNTETKDSNRTGNHAAVGWSSGTGPRHALRKPLEILYRWLCLYPSQSTSLS